MEFSDDAIIATGDSNRGFVTLHLTDAVKLRHTVTFLYIPGREDRLLGNTVSVKTCSVYSFAKFNNTHPTTWKCIPEEKTNSTYLICLLHAFCHRTLCWVK